MTDSGLSQAVTDYIRTNKCPTTKEVPNVLPWFCALLDLMKADWPDFLWVDTHAIAVLGLYKPDLSFHIAAYQLLNAVNIATVLELKVAGNRTILTEPPDDDKGQALDYVLAMAKHQPHRRIFVVFLSDGYTFYALLLERSNELKKPDTLKECTMSFLDGLALLHLSLKLGIEAVSLTVSPVITDNGLQLAQFLGGGANAVVFKVLHDQGNVREFALKLPNGPLNSIDTYQQEMIQREFECLELLHQNRIEHVPTAKILYSHSQTLCGLAIHPVGISIAGLFLQRHALELLKTLEQIHKIGVIHHDLRPGNLILVDGTLYLIDWGSSCLEGDLRRYDGTWRCASDRIVDHLICGNDASFMAQPQDDLHAFVRTMFRLLNPHASINKLSLTGTLTGNPTLQKIKDFWATLTGEWEKYLNHAEHCNYEGLKPLCFLFTQS